MKSLEPVEQKHKLGQFFATAICGNDILSSALYVSGIAALFAGIYAPLILFLVGMVLMLYRSVYREVVEALPINGGAYNALLNSTTKVAASIAGTMTVLSYVATAVISAKTAVEYFLKFWEEFFLKSGNTTSITFIHQLIIPATIGILALFALLVIFGVKDSAKVAATIFSIHIIVLITFISAGIFFIITHGFQIGIDNYLATANIVSKNGGLFPTLFFAFSVSLLGVSGFESSANFVEEQKKGVFKKTLRNMAVGVTFFNPLIAGVSLCVLPLMKIFETKDFLLASVSFHMGGMILLAIIAFDALLVLSGAVLTSYVGVTGLVYRMSMDNALPAFLAKTNKNGSNSRITIAFLILCLSILALTKGNLLSLAGVYTISFLSVMTLFALSNIILRTTRKELKRPFKASLIVVILAFLSTAVGLLGNIMIDKNNVLYFLIYFIPSIILVLSIIFRKDIFNKLTWAFQKFPMLKRYFLNESSKIADRHYYIFLHHTSNLYQALRYIDQNEGGHNVTIVHCLEGERGQKKSIQEAIPVFKKTGVFSHMNVDFKYLGKKFNPETIKEFVDKHNTSSSKIFMGSIHHFHDFDYSDFGGVRIILE